MSTPPRLWRNGLDYEPKKTYPPDYSNVPDPRDWQMSPFSKERFDLDEIEAAERKGAKGKEEAERLKRLYGKTPPLPEEKKPKCPVCIEREKAERLKERSKKCNSDYLYQPYGPVLLSSVSFSRPESNRPKLYNILGPSSYSAYNSQRKKQEMSVPDPCQPENNSSQRDFSNVYVPYGAFGEIRFSPDMYVPMGPTVKPRFQ